MRYLLAISAVAIQAFGVAAAVQMLSSHPTQVAGVPIFAPRPPCICTPASVTQAPGLG